MSKGSTPNAGRGVRSGTARAFFWVAIAAVCVSLIAAFHIGVERGFRDSLGKESYGRILFAVGAAITRAHGGYGYSLSSVVETILTFGGVTADPTILGNLETKFPDNLRNTQLINAAIDKALTFKWPFDPNHDVRGGAGDDLGLIDYARLGFMLFGYRVQSLYYVYFMILAASIAAFLYAFRHRPGMLALLMIACAGQVFVFSSSLFDTINPASEAEPGLIAIADPRFLSSLGIIPGLHLAGLLLENSRSSRAEVAGALLQCVILTFAIFIRATAVWILVGVVLLNFLIAIREVLGGRFKFTRLWVTGALLAVWAAHYVVVSLALHPAYRERGEITHHVFWHAVFYQLQFHPLWNEKYGAQFDGATYDELPPVAAKKYLLRHPPPDPAAVYFTPDRRYLRVAAAETYIRKAFFEFFYDDPRFVLETVFIYNPITMYHMLATNLSSLDRTTAMEYLSLLVLFLVTAGFLSVNDTEFRSFARGALLVLGGFLVSLLPILVTVPGIRTMGDQYYALLITLGSLAVLSLTAAMRAGLRLMTRRSRVYADAFDTR
jgi:hypothetical protein